MRLAALILVAAAACGPSKPTTQPAPAPAPDAATAETCVMPDGSVVATYCAPLSRPGDPPMHTRNDDGTCGPCLLRCLPPGAQIATPVGDRAVSSLAAGDLVWTLDADGARVAAPILRVRPLAAPRDHQVVRVTLDDGRVVTGSPLHPTADGRTLGALVVGGALDGATVRAIAMVALDADATWDLLPDSATGAYWADGVLLGSTLR